MTEEFEVQNVKCGGCIKTIEDGLGELPGVSRVTATLEGDVSVEGDTLDRAALAAKLSELGYPEA